MKEGSGRVLGRFSNDFGRVLDGFWENFGKIFEAFSKDLEGQTMIRATKGKSMDGWMDGWSRPNHMPSHLDALQTTASVNFRRGPGKLHSVAKRASFCVAFRVDFRGFGRPTWTQKSMFGPHFCDVPF